jgi:uncharacterized protein YciI
MILFLCSKNGDEKPMKYFAAFLPMKDPQLSQEHRQQHLDYLAQRRSEGKIFASGRFADGAGGLVIYLAETEQEVIEIVKQDPYVISGARGYEVHEWDMVTEAILPSKP